MKKNSLFTIFLLCLLFLFSCGNNNVPEDNDSGKTQDFSNEGYFDYAEIPDFDGETAYVTVNGNKPFFNKTDRIKTAFENYGKLDNLGRCTTASANISKKLMPTKKRENIGTVKPTGWQIAQYDCVEGSFLYNRCHLIGYQLTGENANERNLITGTRFLNTQGMLPFENMVADYIKETGNHVLYRVTPIFEGREVIARGVLMEGFSVEDGGEGICFNVFCYNAQPDVEIDYLTGKSKYIGKEIPSDTDEIEDNKDVRLYVLNTNSKRIHKPNCQSVEDMDDMNRLAYRGSIEELRDMGYKSCGSCKP
ncbi:MAG: DNA/RNA non-specific endonuclease [Clostridia bacterium]|nr:DNA/RNA non-specific endonuclease [Clostridia bacterium]